MEATVAQLSNKEQRRLAIDLERFKKELEKLSASPSPSEKNDPKEHVQVRVYNIVKETDEELKRLITNAFEKSTWKRIIINTVAEEYQEIMFYGDLTAAWSAIFLGLAHNTFVEKLHVDVSCEEYLLEDRLPVSIPSLPPNLTDLKLCDLVLLGDAANAASGEKGLPELIQDHKNLKKLEIKNGQLCPKALGIALCFNKSLKHILFSQWCVPLKEFFNEINNNTLHTLALEYEYPHTGDHSREEHKTIISDIKAMHGTIRNKRLTLQKLSLIDYARFGIRDEVALLREVAECTTRLMADCNTLEELYLKHGYIGHDGIEDFIASLQNKERLRVLRLEDVRCSISCIETFKDFVRSKSVGRTGKLEWKTSFYSSRDGETEYDGHIPDIKVNFDV